MLRTYISAQMDCLPDSTNWAVLSVDIGSVSIRTAAITPSGEMLSVHSLPFAKRPPDNVEEIVTRLHEGVRLVVGDCRLQGAAIIAVVIATTIPNHIFLGRDMRPIHRMIPWNEAVAMDEATEVATHNRALGYPLSPSKISGELVLCRVLHEFREHPPLAGQTTRIVEMSEYLGFLLTGQLRANLAARWWRWLFDDPPIELMQRLGLAEHTEKLRLSGVPLSESCGELTPSVAAEWGLPGPVPVFYCGWDTLAACAALSVFAPGILVVSMGTSWNVMMSLPAHASLPPTPLEWVRLPGVGARLAASSVCVRDAGALLDDCLSQFCGREIDAARREGAPVHEVIDRRISALPATCHCVVGDGGRGHSGGHQQLTVTVNIRGSHITPLHVYAGIRAGFVDQIATLVSRLDGQGTSPISVIRVCGGFPKSDLICRQLADATRRPVQRGPEYEVVRGAALLTYTHLGYYQSYLEAAHATVRMRETFLPELL
jgi:sugar (pentulose or hexulose) kinase